ncbi:MULTISPECIES: hypothetical protein [unclassified Halomonas]|uniref:hypothetical protein n=1 Tax=unclassified Halomonas TaxID=2609666 RepID=UPI002887B6D6|nr:MULTISPECIES: hypothetical protein [unclassified Halomonas]MDT0499524.1 hypothetical protein [Halomonas sp. PAR7]MDT0510659.1 hypothetical protein [Halomonas sp. LES1]MDT0592328.1 hypothetical protein [Halomonas sp. PAR8]
MKSEDFDKCRQFLEKAIENSPDNGELLKVYLRLIELKSEYDKETDKARIEKEIREAEINTQYQTAVHTNNTDLDKAYHTNNTNYGMAVSQQQGENYRHYQTQVHGTAQSAMQHGVWPPQVGHGGV